MGLPMLRPTFLMYKYISRHLSEEIGMYVM
jgi:hypothetical protein